ncbi:MAG: alpha/beta hydrolase [Actinomycetota bacterium]
MTDSRALAIEEDGPESAPLVVLVHGSMDRMAGFAKIARRLALDYRVLRYDRRGYGASVAHPGPFSVSDHADDLIEVLGDRRAVLVGHSMGGNVVLAVADRRPDLVRGVAVYETPLTWTPEWPANSTSRTIGNDGRDPGDVAEAFMQGMIGRERWERLPETSRLARRAEGRVLLGEMISVRNEAPWDAARIGVPVMVGRGSLARPHHLDGMVRLAAMIGGAQLVTLDGCHHMAHTAASDQFVDELIVPVIRRALP